MRELSFPEPPPDTSWVSTPSVTQRQTPDPRDAELERLRAEVKRLREQRDAKGLRKVVGMIAEGIGAAVALTLTFGALAAVVAGIAWVFGWRP